MTARKLHFILPVWGESYINTMLAIFMPLLLSEKNIPSMRLRHRFSFCVTQSDMAKLKDLPEINKLADYTQLDFIIIDDILSEYCQENQDRYKFDFNLARMTACHNRAMAMSKGADEGFVFLQPDSVFFSGALSNLEKLINDHPEKNIFYSYGLHIEKERLIKELSRHTNGIACDVSSYELIRYALGNLHGMSRNSFVESDNFFPTGNMFFHAGNNGALLRMNILHPVAVFLKDSSKGIDPRETFDNSHFILENLRSDDDIFYIEDSSCFFLCSVDTEKQKSVFYKPYGSRFNHLANAIHIRDHIDTFFIERSFRHTGLFKADQNADFTDLLIKCADFTERTLFFISVINSMKNSDFDWKKLQFCVLQWKDTDYIRSSVSFVKMFSEALITNNADKLFGNGFETGLKAKLAKFTEDSAAAMAETAPDFKDKLDILSAFTDILNYMGQGKGFENDIVKKYHDPSEKLKKIMKEHKKTVLFSAGEDTRYIIFLNNFTQKDISCVYDDSKDKNGTNINGIPVINPDYSSPSAPDAIVIISSLYGDKIMERITPFYTHSDVFSIMSDV